MGLHPPASGYLHTRAARVKPASSARCGHTQACVRQQQAGGRAGDAGSGRGRRPTTAGVQIEGPGRTAARRRKVEMSACGVASPSVASTLVAPATSSKTLALLLWVVAAWRVRSAPEQLIAILARPARPEGLRHGWGG